MIEQQHTTDFEPDLVLEKRVASLIVASLNLDIEPDEIKPLDPLFGDALGLDSIDILEIALMLSKEFGIQIKADHEGNAQIFSSLRSLTAYISAGRTK